MEELSFTTGQVYGLAELTRNQIQHWIATGLITSEVQDAAGGRKHRRWSLRDLIGLRTIRQLLANGLSVQRVRKVVAKLREWTEASTNLAALARARIVVMGNGERVAIITEAGKFAELWPQAGQMYLFDMREVVHDVLKAMEAAGMDREIRVLRTSNAWILKEEAVA